MRKHAMGVASIWLAMLTACLTLPALGAGAERDVEYGELPAQRLDVYAPEGAAKAPVMLYVHGGGWRIGDKARVGRKAAFFNSNGWVFVSVNYRLLPDGKHPNNVEDVAAAIAWGHDHIAEHGGNPGALFIMGHSAGCHLVSLAATDERPLAKAGKPLSIIKGVVALDSQAYDIPALLAKRAMPVYTSVFGSDPKAQADASPKRHVARDKGIPPFLIFYSKGTGRQASPTRKAQANAFAAALNAAGVQAEVVDASDRTHGQINQRFGDTKDDKVTGKALTFLTVLLPKPEPPAAE